VPPGAKCPAVCVPGADTQEKSSGQPAVRTRSLRFVESSESLHPPMTRAEGLRPYSRWACARRLLCLQPLQRSVRQSLGTLSDYSGVPVPSTVFGDVFFLSTLFVDLWTELPARDRIYNVMTIHYAAHRRTSGRRVVRLDCVRLQTRNDPTLHPRIRSREVGRKCLVIPCRERGCNHDTSPASGSCSDCTRGRRRNRVWRQRWVQHRLSWAELSCLRRMAALSQWRRRERGDSGRVYRHPRGVRELLPPEPERYIHWGCQRKSTTLIQMRIFVGQLTEASGVRPNMPRWTSL
jgi:hypothetical protein